MNKFNKITWSVATLIAGYLLLRIFTGVSQFDLGGYGTFVYFILLASYLGYTFMLAKKETVNRYKLFLIAFSLLFLVFTLFFVVLNFVG